MAKSVHIEKVVGNPGQRAFSGSSSRGRSGARPGRRNPGEIIGFTLANPGRKGDRMATAVKKKNKSKSSHKPGYAVSHHNPGKVAHKKKHPRRHNTGSVTSGIGPMVTNALFVIVGALGSKLAAQAVLGTSNTGVMGYAGNAGAGAVMWFVAEKVLHNRAAAGGIIAGTLVQILLRVINDYTPFGSFVNQLGMGDYQMQSFVTPQVLVDPWRSADIRIPTGWGPAAATAAGAPMVAMPAAAAASASSAAAPAKGMGGGLYGGRGGPGIYRVA